MASGILDQLETFGPERCRSLDPEQALAYTRGLVRSHYENFSVVSRLLPAPLRDDFANVYAFCRWADDLGDETGDRSRSLELLAWWRRELDACYEQRPRHPVFVALSRTIADHDIPRRPFDDLIDAFVQDQSVTRYRTWAQVLDYCRRSANPVGRLVLYVAGYRDEQRQRLADATCTALQLANFWQDVRRDILERDRIYLPEEAAARHGLDLAMLAQAIRADAGAEAKGEERGARGEVGGGDEDQSAAGDTVGVAALGEPFEKTLRDVVDRTWPLFNEGRRLWPLLDGQIRPQIKLFTYGGESILKMIERQRYDTLSRRPRLGKAAKVGLMGRALADKLWHVRAAKGGGDAQKASPATSQEHAT